MDMDNIDRKILTILQQNARTPLKVIAEQVFLSSPAVSARIERLESAGYILGYQAQLSCAAMGYQIKAFINLEIEPSQKPEFYPYIEGCPNVMECDCVTGDYSMFIRGLLPYDAGAGSIHQSASSLRQNAHADRLFHAGGASRHSSDRA